MVDGGCDRCVLETRREIWDDLRSIGWLNNSNTRTLACALVSMTLERPEASWKAPEAGSSSTISQSGRQPKQWNIEIEPPASVEDAVQGLSGPGICPSRLARTGIPIPQFPSVSRLVLCIWTLTSEKRLRQASALVAGESPTQISGP